MHVGVAAVLNLFRPLSRTPVHRRVLSVGKKVERGRHFVKNKSFAVTRQLQQSQGGSTVRGADNCD